MICLVNMIFLALNFLVHPTTYGPPNHSEGIQVNQILTTNSMETYGFALGRDMCKPTCSWPFKVFTFAIEALFVKIPLVSVISLKVKQHRDSYRWQSWSFFF